jgi:hypothetical protein
MFRTLSLLLSVTSTILVLVAPAHADSTTTQTVSPGGSMRSSPDAAPSPANPVIVTITERTASCSPGCSRDATYTITLKTQHERANGPGLEGPSGYDFVGPQIDIAGDGNPLLTFDVDRSVLHPGFIPRPSKDAGDQLSVGFKGGVGTVSYKVDELPDGDYRVTPECCGAGSYDLFQQAFFVNFWARDSLPDALRNGVAIGLGTNYQCTSEVKITVSSAVAAKLKLKSTTIGARSFGNPCGGDKRVPLVKAARAALKRYKRVAVTGVVVAVGPEGKTLTNKRKVTLKQPASELG